MRDLFDEFLQELKKRQAGTVSPDDPDTTEADAGSVNTDDEGATPGDAPAGGAARGEDTPGAGGSDSRTGESGGGESGGEPDSGTGGPDLGEPEPIRVRMGARRSRGGGPPRGPRRRSTGGPNDGGGAWSRVRRFGGRFGLAVLIVVVLVLISLLGVGLDLWTDAIWFTSVGYQDVFWTRVLTQFFLFIGVFAVSLLVLGGNLWLASRLSPPPDPTRPGSFQSLFDRLAESARQSGAGQPGRRRTFDRYGTGDEPPYSPFGGLGGMRPGGGAPLGPRPVVLGGEDLPDFTPVAGWVLIGIAILAALAAAGTASSSWETILLWLHRVPFAPSGPAVTDPVFGRDISFFLFDLPFIRLLQSVVNALLLGALLISLARYVVGALRGSLVFTTQIRVHLAILAGLYLLSVAAGYQLDKFELVYSARGVATGVSYTDANAQFFAFDALTVIAALAAAFLVGGAFTRMIWPLGLAVGVWFVASIVLGQLYPAAVQQFSVKPDERAKESTYISYNIQMTDLAYKLTGWLPATNYGGEAPLTQTAITNDQATFDNARLWDYRPLQQTLDQLQTVRTYYDFNDVDTDRYMLNGQLRQVMLSARELKGPQGDSWVNQKITFTHGVGLAFVPVNGATSSGQPNLLIRDLPPVSSGGAPTVKQFRIYFGEEASDYVIVDARQPEFDYPVGNSQAGDTSGGQTTSWQGTTGIHLENTLTRLLFALRFRDLNMLISDQVTAGSQLLFHQNLQDRLNLVAPFLVYDKDPYLVVTDDGRLEWIQDAYTISDRFPNAQYADPSNLPAGSNLANVGFNYVRNSVKVVIDAYDGTMSFYAADPTDPILRAYEGVFPTLFKPMSAMPAGLVPHLRVPEELFNVQTRMFERYHITNPDVFYSGQDLWTVPTGSSSTQSLPAEAYYVVMRLPGESSPEFLLLQPMVPRNRPNMIAWVAARNDGQDYGQVKVFQFPENTSVLGPVQIEAQIDADPTISAQVTLWNQSGSSVIRGNLIVLPVGDSIIYLQPVYLASSSSNPLPELQKVILATSSKIVWGDNLAQAIQLLLAGGSTSPSPPPSTGPSPSPGASATPSPTLGPGQTPPSGNIQALVDYANTHFDAAQAALRSGDFARYGQEIALVQEALRQLRTLTGSSLAPGASPTP